MGMRSGYGSLHAQRGTTLVVAMLFLLVLSLFAVASFNASTTNTLVTGNMISRQEAAAAAQWLIDDTISSTLFATNPEGVAAGVYAVDLDLDANPDYFPRISPAPACTRTRPVKSAELDASVPQDVGCMTSGVVENSGLDTPDLAASTGNSLCANTNWNVRAVVDDTARNGAVVAVNQGVSVRVLATDALDYCF